MPARLIYLVLALLSISTSASSVMAQSAALASDPNVMAAVEACRDDRDRLCADIAPGGGRILRCLAGQAQNVSPGCKAAITKARAALTSAGIAIIPFRIR
jgi:Cysteine rich repeat